MDVSLLYPENYGSGERDAHRMKNYDFIQALSIDTMIVIENDTFRGLPLLRLEDFYSTDPAVISYRLDVVEELLQDNGIEKMFLDVIPMIRYIFDMNKALSSDFSVDTALSSIKILENYVEVTDRFYETLRNTDVTSAGLTALKKMITETAESDEFRNLKKDISKTETDFNTLKSVTIGVNLDENLQVESAGIVSINRKPFRPGTLIDHITGHADKDPWTLMTMLYSARRGKALADFQSLDKSVGYAIQSIYEAGVKSFEPIIQKYYAVNTSMYVRLFADLRVLTAVVQFIQEMRQRGLEMVKPEIAPVEAKQCRLQGVYNVSLARSNVEEQIVANDFTFDDSGRFYILTGPNHGGKSIFAYSIGMAQALFQLGCFVPAHTARMSPVTGIFTHFPSSDVDNFGKGRLESECDRLSTILRQLTDTDLLLMDESFSSTSALEASYIAQEVLIGIGVIGCGGIYVTHIHDLCEQTAAFNGYPGNRGKIDNLAAVMQSGESGKRSYRIRRIKPDGLSYARDIADRYGLNFTDHNSFRQ
jgi:DNA mismatch repair protein MutS